LKIVGYTWFVEKMAKMTLKMEVLLSTTRGLHLSRKMVSEEQKMPTKDSSVFSVRLKNSVFDRLKKEIEKADVNKSEFIDILVAGLEAGDIKIVNGSVRGSSTEAIDPFADIPDFDYDEYEYVHSILKRIGSRVRTNSMRELADYLEKKILGGY
jgi:hypothetical protein